MKPFSTILLLCCVVTMCCCQRTANKQTQKALFDSIPSITILKTPINETSGIQDSHRNPGYLWIQQDSRNPNEIELVKHDGTMEKKVTIAGVTNRDWEDMAINGGDIYIGEIGDNSQMYSEYAFYKFAEPKRDVDVVKNVEIIRFKYPDGSHDAEAFLVDPKNNSIYIITKRDSRSKIYQLSPPFTSGLHVAKAVGELPYGGVVSAAISPDRKEIIIKTYFELGYYKIDNNASIESTLRKEPTTIPYIAEPQGEAVCFSALNNGYFTLSERSFAQDVKLYFYKRK